MLSCGQVRKMGSGAIAISLPFSCVLGIVASMTSTTLGNNIFNFSKLQIPLAYEFSSLMLY